MATGYDSRQVTRNSFAFQGAAPLQARSTASGASARAQVAGGESQGGVVTAGPQTDPGPTAGQLGAYFEGLMQPFIQRKQQERFFQGFTAAQSGVALDEIEKSSSGIKNIFGPTGYQQGAEFFTAQSAIDKWAQQQYDNMDELKKLDPADASKRLADTSQALMTNSPFANQMIQSGLIEASGPLMNAVAKKRQEYQQQTANNAWTLSANDKATTLQKSAQAQASMSDATDEPSSAMIASSKAFLGGMVKPAGMDDETYRKGMFDFMRNAMANGNFYAVSLMERSGIDNIFDEDQRTKLEDAKHRYGEQAMERLMSEDEGVTTMMRDYEEARAHSALGEPNDPKSMSPMQAAARLAAINAHIKRMTGLDQDFFDFKDIRGETRSMMDLVVASAKRLRERQWQLEDRQFSRDTQIYIAERDEREASAAAGAAWASGDVEGAIAGGVEEKHFNRIALSQFRRGDYAGLARAFAVGNYTSAAVKNSIQGIIKGSLEEQYGENFQRSFQTWQAMMKVNPGMTREYFGDYQEKMRTFGTLSKSIGPEAAYRQAFGDPARYSGMEVPANMRKEADTAIASAVNNKQSGWYNPLGTRYSPQALRVMQNLTHDRVAAGLQNSDTPASVLAPEALNAAMADGSLQIAGGEAWRAASGTKPFRVQIGMQQDEADRVFHSQVDFRLKRAGLKTGINSTLEITYVTAPNRQQALHIVGRDSEGGSANILVPMAAFKEARNQMLAEDKKAREDFLAGERAKSAAGLHF